MPPTLLAEPPIPFVLLAQVIHGEVAVGISQVRLWRPHASSSSFHGLSEVAAPQCAQALRAIGLCDVPIRAQALVELFLLLAVFSEGRPLNAHGVIKLFGIAPALKYRD